MADVLSTEQAVIRACVDGGEKLQFALSSRGLKYKSRGASRKEYKRIWRAVQAGKERKDVLAHQKKSILSLFND